MNQGTMMNTQKTKHDLLDRAAMSALMLTALLLTACASQQPQAPAASVVEGHANLNSVLWTQTAVEYRMSTVQAFRLAASQIPAALADSDWSAMPEQTQRSDYQSLPLAVIMDVDETLLDNSPFQVRMMSQGLDFDVQQWRAWVAEAQAQAMPGARAFIQYLKNNGIRPYYVSNRELEAPTLANIRSHLDPTATAAQVMVRNERPDWGSDKASRRQAVASEHRVLLLLGDDYNDFIQLDYDNHEQRNQLAEQYQDYWGKRWVVLPNPQYGHWERVLSNPDKSVYLRDRADRQ
jgi:5'-nucleotidase (lipoprotein e(P4) family)